MCGLQFLYLFIFSANPKQYTNIKIFSFLGQIETTYSSILTPFPIRYRLP